ncbi:hypothetical protein MP228_001487 [Amoeboaphelidium protococcarum]|nr:hypothetical protein MP228_001487 [Amoeboaphelidium protococcarum]
MNTFSIQRPYKLESMTGGCNAKDVMIHVTTEKIIPNVNDLQNALANTQFTIKYQSDAWKESYPMQNELILSQKNGDAVQIKLWEQVIDIVRKQLNLMGFEELDGQSVAGIQQQQQQQQSTQPPLEYQMHSMGDTEKPQDQVDSQFVSFVLYVDIPQREQVSHHLQQSLKELLSSSNNNNNNLGLQFKSAEPQWDGQWLDTAPRLQTYYLLRFPSDASQVQIGRDCDTFKAYLEQVMGFTQVG